MIAIIGTAGRDKTKPMNLKLWTWMIESAIEQIPVGSHVVSGGAAWADHLAVQLFLMKHAKELTLYLPAPIRNGRFIGPSKSAASAANFYHDQFSTVIGYRSINEIEKAAAMENCSGTFEPIAEGYGAMFVRNAKVAKSEKLLAYTFGQGHVPIDGGTKDTWDKCKGIKLHIPLPYL